MKVNLNETGHRPWPLPAEPWIMAQTWHDLLFSHWPVSAEPLRPHIPERLQIDTFEGQAWLGVVPFRMSGVRLRATLALPWLSKFPELNVRTYVTAGGKPGVWFFSLDAANPVAVAVARAWFHLPYFHARMKCDLQDGWIQYTSERTHRSAPHAELRGQYRPIGSPYFAKQDTLESFLTERYCLYTVDRHGRTIRGEIHHAPWSLQSAEVEFSSNTMAAAAGFSLPRQKPLLHFSRRQDVVVWRPRPLPD